MTRKLYGWQSDGAWYLSWFKNEQDRPKNRYATQQEAIAEANRRGTEIEWLP